MNSHERKILVAHDGGSMSGLALLKDTADEKKICTFFILPEYRGQNLGKELMQRSLRELAERDISITVAEERREELSPILVANGFTLEKKVVNHYRKERTEFFYSR
jgi:GNAT superfamily N-acetyltransferase